MARYIVRRLMTMLLTMVIVSMLVFAIVEIAPGNVARNILGAYATPEQELSMANQLGLTRPVVIRYISWLLGSDWQASPLVGLQLGLRLARCSTALPAWALQLAGSRAPLAVPPRAVPQASLSE